MATRNQVRSTMTAVALLVLTAGAAFAQPAGGGGGGGGGGNGQQRARQPGGGGGPGGMGMGMMVGGLQRRMQTPAINGRQFEKFGSMLGLNDEQKASADELLQGYTDQVRRLEQESQAKMEKAREEFRESRDPAVFEPLANEGTRVRAEREKLDASLMGDFKLLLDEKQLASWPKVELTLRRDQSLRRGNLSGERVDILQLVEQAKFAPEVAAQLKPVLDEYELALDRELKARDEVYLKTVEELGELRRDANMEKMQASVERGRAAGMKVRDLNRKTARQIKDVLPIDLQSTWEKSFKQASFPEAYRETQSLRALKAAQGMEDLTADQKAQVQVLADRTQKRLGEISEKMAEATEEAEKTFRLDQVMQRGQQQDGGNDPANTARRERREADRGALEELKKILTPEQAAKLPQPERDQGGDGQGGRRRGMGRGGNEGGGNDGN